MRCYARAALCVAMLDLRLASPHLALHRDDYAFGVIPAKDGSGKHRVVEDPTLVRSVELVALARSYLPSIPDHARIHALPF